MALAITSGQWARLHHDAEMSWAIQEAISAATQGRHSFRTVFEALSRAIADMLCAREDMLHGLLAAEDLYAIAAGHFGTRHNTWRTRTRHQQAEDILPLWLGYAYLLTMGMPAPNAHHRSH